MKNLIKYLGAAVTFVALTGSVYGIPTLVVTDGAGISTISTDASGVVTINTSDADWSVVVATGTSTPPITGGNPSTPVLDLLITASYIGHGGGDPLVISFANDSFGPTIGSFLGNLSGQETAGGFANLGWTLYDGAGSHLPTTASPLPPGLSTSSTSLPGPIYSGLLPLGPVALGSPYTLGEEITLDGVNGSLYNIDASISTRQSVPDGGITLIFLGSAMSGLALLKKML